MYLFGVLLIIIGTTAINAEVDCSGRPPHVHFGNCCELSNLISDEVKEKCADYGKDNFGPHPGHPHGPPGDQPHGPPGIRGGPGKFGPHHHCFLSCVVNETGILIDGELQQEELTSYLNQIFVDSEKTEFVRDKFMFCHEKQQNLESKWPAHKKPPINCYSKENGMLMRCVHMETFRDCPESFWSNTDECNEVRDHFNQCWIPKVQGEEENLDGEGKEEEI